MATTIKLALLTLAIAACALLATPVRPAHCAQCNVPTCYSKVECGPQCVCMKEGYNVRGVCVSFQ